MPEIITKEITAYAFHELSDRAKDKALSDWLSDYNYFEPDWLIDNAKEEGNKRGFEVNDVRWSLNEPGEGACWQGRVNLVKFLDYHLKEDNPDHHRYVVLREIINDGWTEPWTGVGYMGWRSVHSGCVEVDYISDGPLYSLIEEQQHYAEESPLLVAEGPLQGADVEVLAKAIDAKTLLEAFRQWIQDEARAYADTLHADIKSAYEEETSMEYFADMAEANGWRFDEDGTIV